MMEAGQIGWLLWWPLNDHYYTKCDRCKEANVSWWVENRAPLYAIYHGDLGIYRARCGCGKILNNGDVDFLPPLGISDLPKPTELLRTRVNFTARRRG